MIRDDHAQSRRWWNSIVPTSASRLQPSGRGFESCHQLLTTLILLELFNVILACHSFWRGWGPILANCQNFVISLMITIRRESVGVVLFMSSAFVVLGRADRWTLAQYTPITMIPLQPTTSTQLWAATTGLHSTASQWLWTGSTSSWSPGCGTTADP